MPDFNKPNTSKQTPPVVPVESKEKEEEKIEYIIEEENPPELEKIIDAISSLFTNIKIVKIEEVESKRKPKDKTKPIGVSEFCITTESGEKIFYGYIAKGNAVVGNMGSAATLIERTDYDKDGNVEFGETIMEYKDGVFIRT